MTPRARKIAITAAVVIAAIIGLCITLLGLLDGEWLRARLIAAAQRKGAKLTISSCDFSPFSGNAALRDVHFQHQSSSNDGRTSQTTHVAAQVASAAVNVRLFPLLSRRVEIDELRLNKPNISSFMVREEFTTSAKQTDRARIARIITGGAWEALTGNVPGIREDDISERKRWFWNRGDRILLASHVVVENGVFEHRLERPGREPFHAQVAVQNYHARNVALDAPFELINRADYEAQVNLGDVPAFIQRSAYGQPPVWSITGVDMTYLDRMLDQTDALRYEAGTLDLVTRGSDDAKPGATWEVKLKGLRLGRDPESTLQTELMVPVENLIKLANSQGGNLTFSIHTGRSFEISPDMDVLSTEILKGVYTNFAKEKKPEFTGAGDALEKTVQLFKRDMTTGILQQKIRIRTP